MTDRHPRVIDDTVLTPEQEHACFHGAAFARVDRHVVCLEGPATVQCVQGLLTNDVDRPGDASFVYGAVLNTKGMILTDLWAERIDPTMTLYTLPDGADALDEVVSKYVPPRLAKATTESDLRVIQLIGSEARHVASAAGCEVPDAGRVTRGAGIGVDCVLSQPSLGIPFTLQIATADAERVVDALGSAGATEIPEAGLEIARIVAGWPALGFEIRDKTLPQEVRFDAIDGVSHTKGCYTGQETVARLHFRGRVNRRVMGLDWQATPSPADDTITTAERDDAGRVTSIAWSHTLERHVGLGLIRREIDAGASVEAAGASATVVDLPMHRPDA